MPYERVEVAAGGHGARPDSGPTVASRTTMIVGGILQEWRAGDEGAARKEVSRALGKNTDPLVIEKQYRQPYDMAWDDDAYRGELRFRGLLINEIEVDGPYEARPVG